MTSAGSRCAALAATLLALAPAAAGAAPQAQCDLSLPANPLVGAPLVGTVTLTPTPDDPLGFQPAVELVLPPEVEYRAGSAVYDVGGPMTAAGPITIPASGEIVNPYTGQTENLVDAGLARPGDRWVLLRYPLSNLAHAAPAAAGRFTLEQTGSAAVGVEFTVRARCLYLLGATPVNDLATDPPLATARADAAAVTPQLVQVDVSAGSSTGAHTVTGPTSPVHFTVRVYVAEGRTVEALTVVQDVDPRFQLLTTPVAVGASAVAPLSPSLSQGGEVRATWSELTGPGSGPAATITFSGYVAEFADGDPGRPVLPPNGRVGASIPVQARITGYTLGEVVVETAVASNVASIVPHGALLAESITPNPSIPGDTVTVRHEVRVSDYRSFRPRAGQGTNTLGLELASGLEYTGPAAGTLPWTCDDGAAAPSADVPVLVTPPAQADDPTTFLLQLPDLPGAGPGGTVTTACHVTVPARVLPTYGLGGPPVYSSDRIPTRGVLTTIVDDGGAGVAASQTEADSGHDATVLIRSFQMSKTLLGAPEYVSPGDPLVWRITGDVLGGATDASEITDYLPAPIFDVSELGPGGLVGAVGSLERVRFDAGTSPYLESLGLTYSTDARTNSITISVPGFPFQGDAQRLVFLVALTIQHEPADDRLTYVNLVEGVQQGSETFRTSAAVAAAFAVNEPELAVSHGVVDSVLGKDLVYEPARPAWAQLGPSASNRWSSAALGAEPLPALVSNVDAGDELILAAVLENRGSAPAYGVRATVAVPGAYGAPTVLALTDGAGTPIEGGTATAAGASIAVAIPSIPADNPDPGTNVVVVWYRVPVSVAVQAQEVLDPAVLSLEAFTSVDLPGAPSFVGTPLTASAGAAVRDLALSRDAVWPSPAYPNADRVGPATATIGDVGRISLELLVPEGTHRDLAISEVLPVGLALVPGSLRIAATSDFIQESFAGGSSPSTGTGGFTWPLGTLVNGATDGAPRALRLEYDVLLQNLASVTAAAPPGESQATVTLGAPATASSLPFAARTAIGTPPAVVEPALALSTVLSPSGVVPGGTTLTVDVTVRHVGSTSPARDVVYALTLPASLSAPSGAAFTSAPAGCAAPSVSGQTVSFECARLATDEEVALRFQATVPATAPINSQFALSAAAAPPVLTWMSVPGITRVDGAAVARTGFTSDAGGAANTYRALDATQVRVTPTSATKRLVGAETRTIGDWVEWDVNLGFPVGTTTELMIDTLPTGLAFEAGGETSSLSNPDPSTLSWTRGDGALPEPDLSGGGQVATWDLGTITRLDGGSGALSFRVRARVQDLPAVASGATLAANALAPPAGAALVADKAIQIVEPSLQVTTTPSATRGDAANTIAWTTTLSHQAGSTAPAHDVALRYVLPGQLAPGTTSTAACTGAVNPLATVAPSDADTALDVRLGALPLGTICTVTWTTTVASDVQAGQVLTPPAAPTLEWRSLPFATAGAAARLYPLTPAALPDFTVEPLVIQKVRTSGANVVIGEPVTYSIHVDVPESGGTPVTVVDTLPSGMELVSATFTDFEAQNLSCTPTPCADLPTLPDVSGTLGGTGTNRVLTWSFGSVANGTDSPATANKRFTIQLTARVANIATNGTSVTTFQNRARIGSGSNVSAASITLRQPAVAIHLSPSATTADAGDTITWTAVLTGTNATAHDVVGRYLLPGKLAPGAAAVAVCTTGTGAAATVGASGADTVLELRLASLGAGAPCTFNFTTTVAGTVQAGELLAAPPGGRSLEWRSQPEASSGGNERVYPLTPAAPTSIQVPEFTLGKTRITGPTAAIGEPVTYRIDVDVPESGGTALVVTDTLPAGMEYVGAVLDFSAGNLTCTAGTPAGACATVAPALSGTVGVGTNRVAAWDLGQVANTTEGPTTANRRFTIAVTARIANLVANGTTLGASYVNLARANEGTPDAAEAVALREPQVAIALTPSTTTADAGDPITWTAVLTASSAVAHDVTARYALPSRLVPGAAATGACTTGTGAIASVATEDAETVLDLALASLAPGATCTFTFTTTLAPDVQAGEALAPPAPASLQWRSQPRATSGGEERVHEATPDAPATVRVPALTLAKVRTAPARPAVTVGEEVVYRVSVGVPEGRTAGVTLQDTLPEGLRFVSARFVNPGDDLVCAPAACTDGAPATPTLAGGGPIFELGEVRPIATEPVARTHSLQVLVTAVVDELPRNARGGSVGANGARVEAERSPAVTATSGDALVVEEPVLELASILTDAAGPDTANVVTFTATLATPADATHVSPRAHDVALHLVLPGELLPGDVDLSGCAGATSDLLRQTIAADGPDTVVDFFLDELVLPAAGCALRFRVALAGGVAAGTPFALDAGRSHLTWSSAAGGGRGYQAEVPPASFTAAPLQLSSALASEAAASVGATVAYDLLVDVPEGATAVTLVETLPAGLLFQSATLSNTDGLTCAPTPCADGARLEPSEAGGQVRTFPLGTVTNAGASSSTVRRRLGLRVAATVADVPGNSGGALLAQNEVSIAGLPASRAAGVRIIEPALAVSATGSPATVDAGDPVTFTVTVAQPGSTADAYDVHLRYPLHAKLGAPVFDTSGCADGVNLLAREADGAADVRIERLPLGASCSISFTAAVGGGVEAGEVLAPPAGSALTWTSLPAPATPRAYEAAPGALSSPQIPGLALAKARTSAAGVSVGSRVVYRVSIGLPEGTTPAVALRDTLPAGLTFVSARFVNPEDALVCDPACTDGAAAPSAVAGARVTFDLGTVASTGNGPTRSTRTLAVDVTAAVADVPENVKGATIGANTAEVESPRSPAASASSDALSVTQPALVVSALTSDADRPDAGNEVTFSATLASPPDPDLASAAHAVDLRVTLPGTLRPVPSSFDLTGCPGATYDPDRQRFTAIGGQTVVDLVLDTLTLPVTDCALRFRVVLGAEAVAGATLAVDTAPDRSWLRYASAPSGGVTFVEPVPPSTFEIASPTFTAARASAAEAPVGSHVTYDLAIGIPEGVSPTSVVEELPAGLRFREATISNGEGLSCAPGPCEDGAALTPSADGRRLTFDLGTVTSPGLDPGTVRRPITIHVVAVVENAAGNVAGAVLPENAAALAGGESALAPGVVVVEPALTAAVEVLPYADGDVDAGDLVAVATTISSAWAPFAADAHDVELVYALPPELIGEPATAGRPAVTATGACELDETASVVTEAEVRIRLVRLAAAAAAGTSSDCTVTAQVRPADAAVFGRTYGPLPESELTWASAPAAYADRRTGSGAGPLDVYRVARSFDVPISTVTTLAKTFVAGSSSSPETDDPHLALGETARYRLRVRLPEGTTPDVLLVDDPPPGLRILSVERDPDPLQGCTAPRCTSDDPGRVTAGASGEARAIALGTVVLPGSEASGGYVSLLVTVQAVPDAALASTSSNEAALAIEGAARPDAAASLVSIVRGAPAVTLTVDDLAPAGGDVVRVRAAVVNRGTGPACDPALTVALPPELTPVPPAVRSLSLPAGTCIPPGAERTLELDVRVAADVAPSTLAITATLGAYRSLAAGGVTHDPASDGVDSNGAAGIDEPGDGTRTVSLLPVAPVLRFTKSAALGGGGPLRPGGEVLYTLRVENSGTLAARAVVLEDDLPLGNADVVEGSAVASQGGVSVIAGVLAAELGDVGPGATAEVQVRLRVKDPVVTADPISNQARLATSDGYGGLLSDDPATPAPGDPTVVPVTRAPACVTDSDCLLAEWCDAGAAVCRPDFPRGAGVCEPGAPHRGAQCSCDPRLPAAACLPPGVDACEPRDGLCGLVNGSPCAGLGGAVCRSLVCNADGRCGDPDGAACDPGVAPNLTCRSGVCDPASRQCGFPQGATCSAGRECRSGTCGPDGRCGALNGAPCSDAAACRSGVCNADGHCGDPLGARCASGATCRSNTCEAGRCVEPCTSDAGCAGGFFCEPAARSCRPARAAGEACDAAHAGRDCLAGACGADGRCGLGTGEACAEAARCRDGGCAAGRCGGCAADADCASDRRCDVQAHACAPRLAAGEACTPGASGNRSCRSGLCAADGRCGAPDGSACASAAECRSGLCTAEGVCAPAGCTADVECRAEAYCDGGGACAPRRPNGEACERAAMCASAICEPDGRCGAVDREPCDVLAPSPQCRSGACNPADDACGFTGGQVCGAPVQCRVGVCDEGDGLCGLPSGAACAADEVCRSQTCHAGVCTLCTSDAACGAGSYCDFPAGQCAPDRPPLEPCERGAQCLHDVCGRAGVCLGGFQDGVGVAGSGCGTAGPAIPWLGVLAALLALGRARRRRGGRPALPSGSGHHPP